MRRVDMPQMTFRLDEATRDTVNADAEAMGGYGAKQAIFMFGFRCWAALPESGRRRMLLPRAMPVDEIVMHLDRLWPIRLIRAAARLSEADREALIASINAGEHASGAGKSRPKKRA